MKQKDLDQQIAVISQRLGVLSGQAQMSQPPQIEILSETFEELNVTLEELQVAQAELGQRNEELIDVRISAGGSRAAALSGAV